MAGDNVAEHSSVLEPLNTIVKRWRLVVGLPVAAAAAATVASVLIRPSYTATTSFVPEAAELSQVPPAFRGLAGQLGVPIEAGASESPRFYAEVVRSRELLEQILLSRYPDLDADPSSGDSMSLLEVIHVSDGPGGLAKGVKRLRRKVSVRVDNLTNIVTLSVNDHNPVLAALMANRFVGALEDFNTRTRQSRARERRRFVEERVSETEHALKGAEDAVKTFYERNRSWQQSPQLAFEEARLRRQVEIQQELYLALKREYEASRVAEVNDTPVMTVIDRATPPRERSKPRRKLLVSLAVLGGGLAGLSLALGAEFVQRISREEPSEYARLTASLQQMRNDLRRAARFKGQRPS